MSRKGSRNNSHSTTKRKDAGGGSGDDYEGVSDGSSEESLVLSADVMRIDKIYANLRLRSLDDPDILDFRASLADCEEAVRQLNLRTGKTYPTRGLGQILDNHTKQMIAEYFLHKPRSSGFTLSDEELRSALLPEMDAEQLALSYQRVRMDKLQHQLRWPVSSDSYLKQMWIFRERLTVILGDSVLPAPEKYVVSILLAKLPWEILKRLQREWQFNTAKKELSSFHTRVQHWCRVLDQSRRPTRERARQGRDQTEYRWRNDRYSIRRALGRSVRGRSNVSGDSDGSWSAGSSRSARSRSPPGNSFPPSRGSDTVTPPKRATALQGPSLLRGQTSVSPVTTGDTQPTGQSVVTSPKPPPGGDSPQSLCGHNLTNCVDTNPLGGQLCGNSLCGHKLNNCVDINHLCGHLCGNSLCGHNLNNCVDIKPLCGNSLCGIIPSVGSGGTKGHLRPALRQDKQERVPVDYMHPSPRAGQTHAPRVTKTVQLHPSLITSYAPPGRPPGRPPLFCFPCTGKPARVRAFCDQWGPVRGAASLKAAQRAAGLF